MAGREGLDFRLWKPRSRYEVNRNNGGKRNTGDYRRNPLSAAARKGRRSERGRAQICRADSAGGNRGGRGRSVSRNTPNP